jgi:hypothetical protein
MRMASKTPEAVQKIRRRCISLSTGTMLLESLKHELDKALNRAGAMSFADARALGSPLFEDYGDPALDLSEYFQIQTELLDSWKEEELETLHITVVARDQSRAIGGDVYLRSDGAVEIGEHRYEYINGVPRPFA